jgi:hypothetical protein
MLKSNDKSVSANPVGGKMGKKAKATFLAVMLVTLGAFLMLA